MQQLRTTLVPPMLPIHASHASHAWHHAHEWHTSKAKATTQQPQSTRFQSSYLCCVIQPCCFIKNSSYINVAAHCMHHFILIAGALASFWGPLNCVWL